MREIKVAIGGPRDWIVPKAVRAGLEAVGRFDTFIVLASTKANERPPEGITEILRAARQCADDTRSRYPDADLCVGLQSGLVEAESVTLHITAVCILRARDSSYFFSTSPGVMLRAAEVEEARFLKKDAYGAATDGRLSRADTLASAILTALKQMPRGLLA